MARFGVKEVADVTFYNLKTGKPELFLDTLKLSNLENGAESVYAQGGKGGTRLVGWDFNRTATFNIQDALLNPKAISMQVGNELENKIEIVHNREVLVAVDAGDGLNSKVSLEQTPLTTGKFVYISEDGYGHDSEVALASITTSGKDLTFTVEDVAIGEQLVVYYQFETATEAEVITISSDKFGGYYKVIGDTLWRNESNGADEKVQLVIPKAKITSSFTITMQPDGEPSVFDFNVDVFKDSQSTDMVKMVRYN